MPKIKYNKAIGRPKIACKDLVKATKDDREAKDYATKMLDTHPEKYVTFDFEEDKKGFTLVYMVKHCAFD